MRNKHHHITKREVAKALVELFQTHEGEPLEQHVIFRSLNLKTHPAKLLAMDVIGDMLWDNFITERPRGTYTFRPAPSKREEERESLLERTFVGRMQVKRGLAFFITEDKQLRKDILIPTGRLRGARDGDKVTARIIDWPRGAKNPVGKVVSVLGKGGDNDTEMHAILAEYGLPYSYPRAVEEAANRIPSEISQGEIKRREDMRGVTTFTIDPRDAKDFDDALSIRRVSPRLWEVGVHIADVTHYVTEDSLIDREAAKRATSIYLVDRTIPMLPERLCNEICSLRPDEDKLTYSVIFLLSEKAEVRDWHLAKTVIRSDRRFVYEEVQKVLEDHGEASEQDLGLPGDNTSPCDPSYRPAEDFAEELITLNRMAKALRHRRFEAGAVDFDRAEPRFETDAKGVPTSVYFKVMKDANKLVEEFMLLANRTVAESIGRGAGKGKRAKTMVYRVHDQPDSEKLMNLSLFVTKFGHRLRIGGAKAETSTRINRLLRDVKGKPEQNVVEMLTLRSMMKAIYTTTNIGHYGLAFAHYTHFTSPIRRYPDMMVHRLLARYAEGGRSASRQKYEELCDHSSKMEQLAAQAERSSVKYKQVEFMKAHMGQEFEGTISGVTDFGVYVELDENKCEGLVPLRALGDDYYEFDEKNYQLWGRRHHRRFTLGDKLTVRVAKANLDKKQLDFELADL